MTMSKATAAPRTMKNFWGGKLALEYRTEPGTLLYGLVSRGYKAGGYNSALASKLPDLEQEVSS